MLEVIEGSGSLNSLWWCCPLGKVKKKNKKNTHDAFMYVCEAKKCKVMFFYFFFNGSFAKKFPRSLEKKNDGF